jgi:hypothetical protein
MVVLITKDHMFGSLLEACPSFEPVWREFAQEAERRPDEEPLYYILLGDLARHLVQRLKVGVVDEFPGVFQVVEDWHVLGDPYVQEAATIGLLEGIQHSATHEGIDPQAFAPWLLPQSRNWWSKLNRFCDGDAQALRDD